MFDSYCFAPMKSFASTGNLFNDFKQFADETYFEGINLDALDKLYKYTFILSSIGSLDVRDVTRGLADKISTMVEEVDMGDLLKNMPKN